MLILASDETMSTISQNMRPLGFDIIRYRHVLKAMDNIDEIDPAGIIISAKDFPRHWKVIVQFIRYERSKEACPIIILKEKDFPLEEASKAFHIGVSGIVAEDLTSSNEVSRLQSILGRYIHLEDKRRAKRYHTEPWMPLGFCMTNPVSRSLITTTVKTISSSGISFDPDDSAQIENLLEEQEASECSLKIGDDIISPICRIIRKEPSMSTEFIFLSGEEQIMLDNFLETIPIQEVKAKQNQ
jgi:hypothetical protein